MEYDPEKPIPSEEAENPPDAANEWQPVEPEPAPPAAEAVIDVQARPVEEATWASAGTDAVPPPSPSPSAQPEIIAPVYQVPPPKKNTNGWIIAVVVLVILACCCVFSGVVLSLVWNVLWDVLRVVYETLVNVLNSIFNGWIQITP